MSDVNASGIPIEPVYDRVEGPAHELGEPGDFPYARGVRKDMYRGRLWTMRQYAGFATAAESNARYRYLLDRGQTGLSVAFDLPTQLGYDSDAPQARGEVGKVGVAIDSIADMETPARRRSARQRHRLDDDQRAGVDSAGDAPGGRAAARHSVRRSSAAPCRTTSSKSTPRAAPTSIPPKPSMRLVTDVMSYCAREVPQWNTISISGYHIREAGSTAVEEIAFTLSNAKAYLRAARDAGIDLDEVAPRISFFWNAHNDFFEEIAKFRAARYLWAHITRDEFGCHDPRSQMLRFHTQTGGSTLTAQEPENNVVRVTLQALAAVLGGTQSLHTNGKDEALALPTAESAKVALRTQQIIAYESGVADVVDPLAGSYYVESLTNELIERARALIIAEVDAMGGSIAAIESGWMQARIADSAYARSKRSSAANGVVVGVNQFAEAGASDDPIPLQRVDERDRTRAGRAAAAFRAARDADSVDAPARRRAHGGRAEARTSCRISSKRSMPARRWARSATCCATSSEPTAPEKWLLMASRSMEIDHVAIVVKDLEATMRLLHADARFQRSLSRDDRRPRRRSGRLRGRRVDHRAAAPAR